MTNLVSFGGFAGSGKDSAAKALINHGFQRMAFADELKRLLMRVDPIIEARLSEAGMTYGASAYHSRISEKTKPDVMSDEAKSHREVRRLLQALGQGVREIDADFWVRAVENKMVRAEFGEDEGGMFVQSVMSPTVITDVRYPNEVAMVRKYGGVFIWITRPGFEPCNNHESEQDLSELADVVIENGGTVEELMAKVGEVLGL